MKTTDLPIKIRIASPCTARWGDMGGNDRVRFCDQCRKNVYNLSAMTAAEAQALLEDSQGRLCARVFQRLDGTVLTDDCPVGVARQWRRVRTLVVGGLAAIALAFVHALALGRDPDAGLGSSTGSRLADQFEEATWQVKQWLGLNPPMLGMVSRITQAPTPPASSPRAVPASQSPSAQGQK